MVDNDLWWLFCGDECSGQFIGPHPTPESAEADGTLGCKQDHMVLRMSLRQMAAKLPTNARWWVNGIYDPRPTPSRRLIQAPCYPLEASDGWRPLFKALMQLKETTCV